MITYSLQNLLLDDPQLDPESLLGPVVRMRWMSNLLRLAVLEESDHLRAAAGRYTEHDAEIRSLRRSSMAPDAGRCYPVEGKANRVFKHLDTEQARQIVELWRSRQPLGDRRSLVADRTLKEPDDLEQEYSETEHTDDVASQQEFRADDDPAPDFPRENHAEIPSDNDLTAADSDSAFPPRQP